MKNKEILKEFEAEKDKISTKTVNYSHEILDLIDNGFSEFELGISKKHLDKFAEIFISDYKNIGRYYIDPDEPDFYVFEFVNNRILYNFTLACLNAGIPEEEIELL
jgi:hypothetical protein